MGLTEELKNFNFWTEKVDYKSTYSVQKALGLTSKETCHSTSCTSDQDGSQEDGGMDCSTDPSGE